MQSFVTASIVVLIGALSSVTSATPQDYKEINEYLVENFASDDYVNNLAKAAELLEERKELGCLGNLVCSKSSFVKSLEKFVDLETTLYPYTCNRDGYKILRANLDATQPIGAPRRIDKIVISYAQAHTRICWASHQSSIESKLNSLSKDSRNGILLLTEKMGATPYNDTIENLPVIRTLRDILVNSPANKYSFRVESIEEANKFYDLFDRYIYYPCKELDEKVGKNFFKFNLYGESVFELRSTDQLYTSLPPTFNAVAICRHVVEHRAAILDREVSRLKTYE